RRPQLADEVCEGNRARRTLFGERRHGLRRSVEHHALMAALDQSPNHVRAHAPEPNHSELHGYSFHRRKPPANASALLPRRQPGGRSSSFVALPPPIKISSGSSAARRRSITIRTCFIHFFLPNRSSPRWPT